MGFDHDMCIIASTLYPNNVDQAIAFIASQQQQATSNTNSPSHKSAFTALSDQPSTNKAAKLSANLNQEEYKSSSNSSVSLY